MDFLEIETNIYSFLVLQFIFPIYILPTGNFAVEEMRYGVVARLNLTT
jgi:hypothetical protein